MENILQKYEYEILNQRENEYLLHYRYKYYKIGKTIYNILSKAKYSNSIEELKQNLKDSSMSIKQLSEIIDAHILPIFNKDEKISEPFFIKNYWFTKQLVKPKYASLIAKPFKPLFGKIFPFVLIGLLILNVLLFMFSWKTSYFISTDNDVIQIIITYFLLFIILLIHESGHIAASLTEELKPQGIGFGLYYFMPMMYVNLTDAWKLSKSDRTKINMAGITLQMLMNIILFIVLNIFENSFIVGIASKLLITNTFIIAINLIPFFKFDGYWILSDIVNIPNLLQESDKIFMSFFVKKGPFNTGNNFKKSSRQKYFLLLFTFLRLIFLIYIIVTVFMFVIYSIIHSSFFVMSIPYMEFNYNSVIIMLKHCVIFAVVFIICKKYITSIYQFVHRKISK